jgi:hypothetical protein
MNIETAAYLRAVSLEKKDFTNEHQHLVKVLKKGSKQEQQDEADDQAKELKEVSSGGPGSRGHRVKGAYYQNMMYHAANHGRDVKSAPTLDSLTKHLAEHVGGSRAHESAKK